MSPTPPPVHELLLASGIEFIEQAVTDFKAGNYKFSVIHFGSGIEVIMKARICQSDYRLILGNKHKHASLKEFRSGSCFTISPDKCMTVLQNDLSVLLPRDGEIWKDMADFRNRAIHFVLEGVDDQLRILHYHGFYDLKRFVVQQHLPFQKYRKRLQKLDNAIGAIVKEHFEPTISEIYRLLELKAERVSQEITLTHQIYRYFLQRYFTRTEETETSTLAQLASVTTRLPRTTTVPYRSYYRSGPELKPYPISSVSRPNAFTLYGLPDSHDLDFLQHQLAFHWPRLLHQANGFMVPMVSLDQLAQFELVWPVTEQRREITTLLDTLNHRTSLLQRRLMSINRYHDGLRRQSFT